MRTVRAVRYVLPFREGGSVPALVEADDDGLYVVKLRGSAQGEKALVAELVAGELARAAGLAVPELALVEVDATLGEAEPDPEISHVLDGSVGQNLGLDYLPGSITFDPAVRPAPDPLVASQIVLFDSFVTNVDRTAKNPNLLVWHTRLWLIDHGASLYVHHGWGPADPLEGSRDPFAFVSRHVLLPWASALGAAAEALSRVITPEVIAGVVAQVPAVWLGGRDGFADEQARRAAYVAWLGDRLAAWPIIAEEAERARSIRV
jgi:hypothetical protein